MAPANATLARLCGENARCHHVQRNAVLFRTEQEMARR